MCWGYSFRGPDPSHDRFTAVSIGFDHTCALRMDGTPTCWGESHDTLVSEKNQEAFEALSTQSFVAVSSGR